jgi:hypothetical protein
MPIVPDHIQSALRHGDDLACLHPALLVDLERAVHLPVHRELIPANPMYQVGRPKTTKTLAKALHHNVVSELVAATKTTTSAAAATGPNVIGRSS